MKKVVKLCLEFKDDFKLNIDFLEKLLEYFPVYCDLTDIAEGDDIDSIFLEFEEVFKYDM